MGACCELSRDKYKLTEEERRIAYPLKTTPRGSMLKGFNASNAGERRRTVAFGRQVTKRDADAEEEEKEEVPYKDDFRTNETTKRIARKM